MNQTAITEELLVRYLLGRMSEEERDRVDEQYFGDKDFIERLVVVEDELIDSYVRGELSPADRSQFEEHFLHSAEMARRVEFARRWMTLVSRKSAARHKDEKADRIPWRARFGLNSPWVIVPLAASLLFAATGLWLVLQIVRLNAQLDDMRGAIAAREVKEQELEQQLAEERDMSSRLVEQLASAGKPPEAPVQKPPRQSPSNIVAFALNPGLPRSEGSATKLVILPDAKVVRLRVNFDDGAYASYSAKIETVEGRAVWSRSGLKAQKAGDGNMVVLNLPVSALDQQDYVLTLSGASSTGELEAVSEYFFRVIKQ